jgi:hypothetical protein
MFNPVLLFVAYVIWKVALRFLKTFYNGVVTLFFTQVVRLRDSLSDVRICVPVSRLKSKD